MNISKYIGEIEAELQNMELNKMIAEIRSTNVDDSLKIIEVGGMFFLVLGRGVQNIRLTCQSVRPTTDPPALCGSLS